MKGSILKIIVLLLAIAGVIAIGWYLLMGDGALMDSSDRDDAVKVTKSVTPKEEPAPAPAQEVAKEPEAPTSTTSALSAPAMPDLASMTPEAFGAHWNKIDEAERAAFVTDFARTAGENSGIAVARKYSSGPVEGRNYELSYQVAQVLVAEYESRLGSYIAGTMAMQGRGTETDLDAAMRYLRHPALLEDTGALYFRANILLNDAYVKPNRQGAIGLLKKVVKSGSEGDWAVTESRKVLEKLGAN
jgi:hypothetical protein